MCVCSGVAVKAHPLRCAPSGFSEGGPLTSRHSSDSAVTKRLRLLRSKDRCLPPKQISNMALRDSLKIDENLVLMKELEERLKKQIDKLEHLRLSIAEVKDNMTLALCPSSDCGFGAVQQQGTDLKPLIADHLEWLARLNERMEALQMNTTIFVQMNTKPRTWKRKQHGKQHHNWQRPLAAGDALTEFGWSPVHTRRNSDAASEMSCAW
ncbi:uncharacterized protein LOC120535117 [Polypterus senegalus]|uniref:uncharacterized protein LOC120535117 n=1 Tax=Polypterus senegalus TaxID=55291 RepID=UPI0019662AF1|nr:uncharacterized protein LOC120535117 [Polypterus senegalus]